MSKIDDVLNRVKDSDLCDDLFGLYADINNKIDVDVMSHLEIVVTLSWHAFGIIGNGGFRYLFEGEFNGDPGFKITANTFKIIDAQGAYQAFTSALGVFGTAGMPTDRKERLDVFDSKPPYSIKIINHKFWNNGYDIISKLSKYIRGNRLLIETDLKTRLTGR